MMKRIIYILGIIACSALSLTAQNMRWTTFFAYNNVTHIAMSPDRVYAISDGSLFSVDKDTEKIRTYDRQSGLNGTGISCIYYDDDTEQLIIAYQNGKIDLLSGRGVQYIGDLYDKDMTQRKTIYNITVSGKTVYLSTHYGIQTLDIRDRKLVDSYWLLPSGKEKPIADVLIQNDSIYAFDNDSLFCAALTDNLVDYTVWRRERRTGRISPDPDKGKHYQDGNNNWHAGNAEGIIRFTATERLTYKPDGPLVNSPYRMYLFNGNLYVFQGSRWASQDYKDGIVMRYDGTKWHNIDMATIKQQTGTKYVRDFMNTAVDPNDKNHYFVTSYGCGLFEFRNDTAVRQYIAAEDNTLSSAVASSPETYTRIDGAVYDSENNLWMICAAGDPYQLVCLDNKNNWRGLELYFNNEKLGLYTPTNLIIDRYYPNYKWFGTARYNTSVGLLDDNFTPFDGSDDRVMNRKEWTNQYGKTFKPGSIYDMKQDHKGRIWIGTDQGVAYINNEDFFTSDLIVQPDVVDNNGENPLTTQQFNAMCEDSKGNIWLGSNSQGVYVVSPDAAEIIAQYTTDNSAMPSNSVLSMVCDEKDVVFIGTSEGLVRFDPAGDSAISTGNYTDEGLDLGSMKQWKLHYSYTNPQTIVSAPKRVYALADGSLFSVDRQTEDIEYWNRSTGLNGNSIAKIAYDTHASRLIIGYKDGRIDIMSDDGYVYQMPDIYMKASSLAVTINDIFVGSERAYLAMSFGILAVNTAKREISDTYYIGADAADVDVQQIVECGDSLFAFTKDHIYSVALKDNLVDYHYWNRRDLPADGLTYARTYKDELYIVLNNQLYRRRGGAWQQVLTQSIQWAHVNDGKLLVYIAGQGLYALQDDDQLAGLTGNYAPNDALYSNGEYWLCEQYRGLIRLGKDGDDFFTPEGPISNFGYRIYAAHDKIYVTPGGRWSDFYQRLAALSIYSDHSWQSIPYVEFHKLGDIRDAISVAIDPKDAGHFFVATYSAGVVEFSNNSATTLYNRFNSTIREAADGIDINYYTRTDGALYDEEGYFWVLNATGIGQALHVRTPNGVWKGIPLYSKGQPINLTTPGDMKIDNRNKNLKWIIDQRYSQGVILFDDGGTPTSLGDDRSIKRTTFVDQNNNVLSPEYVYCLEQDMSGRIWIGTQAGIILIPANVDFFSSDACRRIIIPRNDGTGLGDYLLGNEQINCLAADGGNRMWIGTANSGLYLIEDDTITVAHFTAENSHLPSNNIQSIAILPSNGEVFVGTDNGIASYRSDASAPHDNLDDAYAFPNPVKPNYGGGISIAGLRRVVMAVWLFGTVARLTASGQQAVFIRRFVTRPTARTK